MLSAQALDIMAISTLRKPLPKSIDIHVVDMEEYVVCAGMDSMVKVK